jgi:adenylate cyclase
MGAARQRDPGALRDAVLGLRTSGTAPELLLDGITAVLEGAGVPLWRAGTALHVLHPELAATQIIWVRGRGASAIARDHALLASEIWRGSPVELLVTGGHDELRVPLGPPHPAPAYKVLEELIAGGGTDYIAFGLDASDSVGGASVDPYWRRQWISFCTDAPGGFEPEDAELLRSLRAVFAVRLALESSRRSTHALLQAYLGANAARRITTGSWRRGTGEPMRAVVWFCDMRGFTTFSDTRPAREVVETLDAYFDAVASPVQRNGGEVLKFIGDAVLAVFPISTDAAQSSCLSAMTAARQACANLAVLNSKRGAANLPLLGLGIAMHTGEVMYGNIGAQDRLDFTVIGAPVNEVCRVEPLTRTLGVDVLLTETFVRDARVENAPSLGKHALKGVGGELEVFALPPLS